MKKYKIAFQGIEGAYSHEALLEFGDKKGIDFEPIASFDFSDLFRNIEKVGLGFVPIENSNAGTVIQVIDLLLEHNIEIIGEHYLSVNHYLLCRKNANFREIKRVYSHPQALLQCSEFLNKNKLKAIPFSDTAGSAKYIQEEGKDEDGSIGSKNLAEIYGLKILKKNIQNSENNVTRFFLVKKRGRNFDFEKKIKIGSENKKTSLIFYTRDIPGALYKALGGFATNGINLTKIESRPVRERNFTYYFYVDFEGSPGEAHVDNSLEELGFFSKKIKILGTYPVERI